MSIKITKHAQSCLEIESEGSRTLIDPGSYFIEIENPKLEDIKPIDLLVITHEHGDHIDENFVNELIMRDDPFIITTSKVEILLKSQKIVKEANDFEIGDLKVTSVPSTHGPLPNGNEPPEVIGVKIVYPGLSVYDPGDTVVLNENADVILTPICGKVVLSIDEAKEQLLKLKPKLSIPIHYDNPAFPVNVDDFSKAMEGTGIEVKVLKNGESIVA